MFLSPLYTNAEYNENDDVEQITVGAVIEPWLWWKLAVIDLDIIVGVACVYWLYFIFRNVVVTYRRKKREEETVEPDGADIEVEGGTEA
jgi:hypothetical protein